eukprot:TRINITY_DN3580_c0_g1_i2.p2 TRINITY_DN3580_c0_g1~~TRINITY_DN3580_c0_g1_i2.p2  ORF type:complete len:184 (-),score=41.81 TRINITY_DN3580_c0_g1_i2:157-708(-)
MFYTPVSKGGERTIFRNIRVEDVRFEIASESDWWTSVPNFPVTAFCEPSSCFNLTLRNIDFGDSMARLKFSNIDGLFIDNIRSSLESFEFKTQNVSRLNITSYLIGVPDHEDFGEKFYEMEDSPSAVSLIFQLGLGAALALILTFIVWLISSHVRHSKDKTKFEVLNDDDGVDDVEDIDDAFL